VMDQQPRPDPDAAGGFRPSPRQVVMAVIAVLLLVFIFSNTENTEISFLFTTVSMPLWLVLLVTTLLGMAIGATLGVRRTKRRYRSVD
jgi:uncharacterized integral membrane protein